MQIDWGAYYREFCRVHGSPVLWRQRVGDSDRGILLFPDGWSYAGRGSESPPPEDEQRHLDRIRIYWKLRGQVLSEELRQLREYIKELLFQQRVSSAPLQVSRRDCLAFARKIRRAIDPGHREDSLATETTDAELRKTEGIDFGMLIDLAKDLAAEVRACEKNLANPQIPDVLEQVVNTAAVIAELEELERTTDLQTKIKGRADE